MDLDSLEMFTTGSSGGGTNEQTQIAWYLMSHQKDYLLLELLLCFEQ